MHITLSIGVTAFPAGPSDNAEAVIGRANMALDSAMAAGGDRVSYFDPVMGAAAERRFEVAGELRRALSGDELRVYLQPQFDATGRAVAAEALVRWEHPRRGLLLPGAFIPYAEESDLIIALDAWMLDRVCALLAQPEHLDIPMRIAVNISARNFRSTRFGQMVRDTLAATGADPSHLTLEVTESVLIEDLEGAVRQMSELSELGIHFSLDDFGTRYASLSYLKRLPIHELKIDRSFIQDAPHDPNDAVLVEAIIAVAQHLNLHLVAEGVETQEQLDFLSGHSDVARQGFLLGRPEPAGHWLARMRAS